MAKMKSKNKNLKSKISTLSVFKMMAAAVICLLATIAAAQDGFTTANSGLKYRIDNPGNSRHPQK